MKNPLLVYFGIALVLGLLGGWLYGPEVGALLFTAVFVAWYSMETHELTKNTKIANDISSKVKNEIRQTNKISITPGLVLEHRVIGESELQERGFTLKNIGKGGAMNIKILNDDQTSHFGFDLNGVSSLGERESVPVRIRRKMQERLSEDHWQTIKVRPLKVTIYFDRIKPLTKKLTTKMEISYPPNVTVKETDWSLRLWNDSE